jgi:predicted phage terminase large subunit-like protein
MCAKYPSTQAVLVEEAANGSAVVDLLKAAIPGLVAVHPEGGKEARAHAVQPLLEARQVFLPNPISLAGYLRPERAWVEDFVTTCEAFPKAAHDDDVDALTQLLVWCRTHAAITPCSSLLTPDPEAERLDRLARRDAARASQFERARRFCQW